MPTYDYICEECGNEFERFQSITSEPLRRCPNCNKNKLRRLLGCGAGVIFKGSGFYQTDYRTENYKKGEKNDKGAASVSDAPKSTEGKKSRSPAKKKS